MSLKTNFSVFDFLRSRSNYLITMWRMW